MPATPTRILLHMIRLLSLHPLSHQLPSLRILILVMDRLEQRIRRMRDLDEMISWMTLTMCQWPLCHYEGLGLDEAQLLTLFPLSLSGTTQRWYASLESSRRRTWEDLAQEFLRQYSFSDDTSVTRRELESLRQDQMRVPFQDFRSLVQALIDVDDGISRGLWSDIIPSPDMRGKELVDHLRAMETCVQQTFSIDGLAIIPMRDHCRYPGVISHLYSIAILIQLASHGMSSLVPIGDVRGLILIWGCLWIELLSDSDLLMAGHRTDYCASLCHTIQDLIDSGAVSFPVSTTDTDLGSDMMLFPFQLSPRMRFLLLQAYTITFWTPRALIFIGHFDTLLVYFETTLLVGRLEHIEIRLLQLRFTMSDEITPITLTALYEMMVDLTRRVERIELILSGHPSSSRGAPGVAMPSLPHLISSTPATLGASHPRSRPHLVFQQHSSSISLATPTRPPPQFRGPSGRYSSSGSISSHRRCRRHFFRFERTPEQIGHHTDRCTALRHAIQDIVDSGTFGHPQSDMSLISTPAQAMHADTPSPAVPDLIDLGD
ncbi:hypothetical protein CK203_092671 [Vitis vinifera]|uniref:Retrotransposon gag domain-containing protein n=1 Tax=Vitis vinifera TaxID=29760 RepID=A0A438ENW4_VITVI|nr:hypothetical protein CK203_092671 [Vitis vinifera]